MSRRVINAFPRRSARDLLPVRPLRRGGLLSIRSSSARRSLFLVMSRVRLHTRAFRHVLRFGSIASGPCWRTLQEFPAASIPTGDQRDQVRPRRCLSHSSGDPSLRSGRHRDSDQHDRHRAARRARRRDPPGRIDRRCRCGDLLADGSRRGQHRNRLCSGRQRGSALSRRLDRQRRLEVICRAHLWNAPCQRGL